MAATQQHSQQLVQHVSLAHDHLSEFAPSVGRKSCSFSGHPSPNFRFCILDWASKSDVEAALCRHFRMACFQFPTSSFCNPKSQIQNLKSEIPREAKAPRVVVQFLDQVQGLRVLEARRLHSEFAALKRFPEAGYGPSQALAHAPRDVIRGGARRQTQAAQQDKSEAIIAGFERFARRAFALVESAQSVDEFERREPGSRRERAHRSATAGEGKERRRGHYPELPESPRRRSAPRIRPKASPVAVKVLIPQDAGIFRPFTVR